MEAGASGSSGEQDDGEWLALAPDARAFTARSLPSLRAAQHCNTLPALRSLTFCLAPHADRRDPAPLSALRHVTRVRFLSGGFPPRAVAAACRAPLLSHLDVRCGAVDDEDARALAHAPRLQKLALCAVPLPPEFLRTLAASTSLTRLSLAGCGARLPDLDVLALYNASLLRVDFFALGRTSALAYHLAASRDRAAAARSRFVQHMLALACARLAPPTAGLAALPSDILTMIVSHLPAPAYAKHPHQLVACARFLFALPKGEISLLLRARLSERKAASNWTITEPTFSIHGVV